MPPVMPLISSEVVLFRYSPKESYGHGKLLHRLLSQINRRDILTQPFILSDNPFQRGRPVFAVGQMLSFFSSSWMRCCFSITSCNCSGAPAALRFSVCNLSVSSDFAIIRQPCKLAQTGTQGFHGLIAD